MSADDRLGKDNLAILMEVLLFALSNW